MLKLFFVYFNVYVEKIILVGINTYNQYLIQD